MADCIVCGWRGVRSRGRCEGCYRFNLRNGRDRTLEEVAHNWDLNIDRVAAPFQEVRTKIAPAPEPVRTYRVDPAELEAVLARLTSRG